MSLFCVLCFRNLHEHIGTVHVCGTNYLKNSLGIFLSFLCTSTSAKTFNQIVLASILQSIGKPEFQFKEQLLSL